MDESISVKRLTRNDVSWLKSGAKSHQCAINLPMKGFRRMFESFIKFGDEIHRRTILSIWFNQSGIVLSKVECVITYYPSKNEIRLLRVPRNDTGELLKEGNLLVIRKYEGQLRVTLIPEGCEHLINELGRNDLLNTLPRQSARD